VDAKKVLLEIFDKLLLGVAALLLAGYLAFAVLQPSPADAARDKVATYNRTIAGLKEIAERNPPKLEPLTAARDIEEALQGGPLPEELPAWLFHKRPLVVLRVKAEAVDEPQHLPPTDVAATPGLGQIAISWQESSKLKWVSVTGYKVYRAEQEPKDWKEIASLDGNAHAYRDRDVRSGVAYYYCVESTADVDKTKDYVKRHNLELAEDQRRQRSDQVGPVMTRRDVFVDVLGATPKATIQQRAAGDNHPAEGFLKVWKWFEEAKEWKQSSPVRYHPGDKIGGVEGFGSSKLDFSTDYVFEDVEPAQVKKQIGSVESVVTINFVVLRDGRTGQKVKICLEEPDPELVKVKANPKGEDAETGSEEKPGKKKSS
jgi:hypothetical protein